MTGRETTPGWLMQNSGIKLAHRKNPVVALAPINGPPDDAALLPGQSLVEFAVDAIEIAFVVQVFEPDRVVPGERVGWRHNDHHLLAK